MKKFILGLILAFVSLVGASAQVVDNGSAKDNWYIGGGVGTQIWNNAGSWHVFNPWKDQQLNIQAFGGKYFTPYFGAELEAVGLFNTGVENKFIDGHRISLDGVLNLSNIIGKYKGHPRKFELEALAGAGWYHAYIKGNDYDHIAFNAALRGNFKVNKNLRIYVMPEYVSLTKHDFNTHPHGVNIYAGVRWNIPSKRGGFPVCKLYDENLVNDYQKQIDHLKKALAQRPDQVVKYTEKTIIKNIDNSYTVFFEQGKSNVENVSAIVEALKNSKQNITIIGGVSPEGSENFNENLAQARAEAVKDALVKAGIDASRINVTSDYSKQRRATIIVGE